MHPVLMWMQSMTFSRAPTLRENILGSVLDEVIWGSVTPVLVGKLSLPLNSMQRVIFLVPTKSVPPIALRRMLESNLTIAKALNVPLLIRADLSYMQTLEALLVHEAVSDFIVLQVLAPANVWRIPLAIFLKSEIFRSQ